LRVKIDEDYALDFKNIFAAKVDKPYISRTVEYSYYLVQVVVRFFLLRK